MSHIQYICSMDGVGNVAAAMSNISNCLSKSYMCSEEGTGLANDLVRVWDAICSP